MMINTLGYLDMIGLVPGTQIWLKYCLGAGRMNLLAYSLGRLTLLTL